MAIPHCSLSREYPKAVAVDANQLRKLDELIRTLATEVGYGAELTDHSVLRFDDLESMIKYENSKMRALRTLRIAGNGKDEDERQTEVTVEISASTYSDPVTLELSGPDDRVAVFVQRFEIWLSDVEQSRLYSAFARQRRMTLYWMQLGLIAFLAISWLTIRAITNGELALMSNEASKEPTPLGLLLLCCGLGVGLFGPMFSAHLLDRLRAAYWPVAVFLTEQGVERHKKMQSRRDMWALGLIFPVLLTIFGIVKC